jgi:GTP cyclohydrolase I
VSRFECTDPNQDGERIALAISELLTGVGEDGDREGLTETPARAAKAWLKWTEGYGQDPQALLKSFEERDYSEMVVVKDIPLYSKCEHHLADIFGTATVAYIPHGRVVGLSKLSRLVNVYARRLQVQERMTVQIANALHESMLRPKGVGVQLRCRHMCMESRGICQQGHYTVTTALRGVIATGEPRAEFLAVAGAP